MTMFIQKCAWCNDTLADEHPGNSADYFYKLAT